MSTRYLGGIKSNQTFEFTSKAPLDSRVTVNTKSDLDTIENVYDGLQTFCLEDSQAYVYTISDGWKPYGKYTPGLGLELNQSEDSQELSVVNQSKVIYKYKFMELPEEMGGDMYCYGITNGIDIDELGKEGSNLFNVVDDKTFADFNNNFILSGNLYIYADSSNKDGYYESGKNMIQLMSFKKDVSFKMELSFTGLYNEYQNTDIQKIMVVYQAPKGDVKGKFFWSYTGLQETDITKGYYSYPLLSGYLKDDENILTFSYAIPNYMAYAINRYNINIAPLPSIYFNLWSYITKFNLYEGDNEDITFIDVHDNTYYLDTDADDIHLKSIIKDELTGYKSFSECEDIEDIEDCYHLGGNLLSDFLPIGKKDIGNFVEDWYVHDSWIKSNSVITEYISNKTRSLYNNPMDSINSAGSLHKYLTANIDILHDCDIQGNTINNKNQYPSVMSMIEFVREEKTQLGRRVLVADDKLVANAIYCIDRFTFYDEDYLKTLNPLWVNINHIKIKNEDLYEISYEGTFRIVASNGYSETIRVVIKAGNVTKDEQDNIISHENVKSTQGYIEKLSPSWNDTYKPELVCDEDNNAFFLCIKWIDTSITSFEIYTVDERIEKGVIWRRCYEDVLNYNSANIPMQTEDTPDIDYKEYSECSVCDTIDHYLKDIRQDSATGKSLINSDNIAVIPNFDDTYQCTLPGVPMTDGNQAVGNMTLNKFTRQQLETMTYNQLFTEIFFKEKAPYVNVGEATLVTSSYEVGTPITTSLFTATVTKNISYGYIKDASDEYVASTANYTLSEITTSGTTVAVAKPSSNTGSATAQYKGSDITLLTSWGNDTYDGGKTLTLDTTTAPDIPLSATIQGYYTCYYVNGSTGAAITPANDLASFSDTYFENAVSSTSGIYKTTNITSANESLGTQTVLIGSSWTTGGLGNAAFVYVVLPDDLKITGAVVRHGLSGAEEALPSDNIVKTSRTNSKGKLSTYNNYTVWQIAKYVKENTDGTFTNTDQPIRIKVTTV